MASMLFGAASEIYKAGFGEADADSEAGHYIRLYSIYRII